MYSNEQIGYVLCSYAVKVTFVLFEHILRPHLTSQTGEGRCRLGIGGCEVRLTAENNYPSSPTPGREKQIQQI